MNLNELRDKAFATATAKGFHDKEYSNEHWLMLVITELSEAVEADRKNKYFDELNDIDNYVRACLIDEKKAFEDYIKGTVEEELADAVIRLLDFAGLKGIDIDISEDATIKVSKKNSDYTFTESIILAISVITGDLDRIDIKSIKISTISTIGTIFSIARNLNINLLWHINQKMSYNEHREPLHGKAY